MLRHSLADGGVGHVNAEVFLQRGENVVFALEHIEVQAVVVRLHGNFHMLVEEVLLPLIHGMQQLHVLRAAVDHAAAIRRNQAVGEIEAALNRPLEQGPAVLTEKAGHVIGRHLHRAGTRRAQTHRETAVEVQEGLRRVFADIGDAFFPLLSGRDNKLVVRLLQEILKPGQIFEIFH